jgi:hypothetical protein
LESSAERLWHDLKQGTLHGMASLAPKLSRTIMTDAQSMPRRAERLARLFRSSGSLAEKLPEVWPQLSLISCWADASAALSVGELQRLFPHVPIQPKGLLSTEGFVSLPLMECSAPALALRSHFFEFVETSSDPTVASSNARVLLAHELEPGGVYRVVLTTAGGLYRYQLQDEVQVAGFLRDCPLLRFLGKADRTSDLVGEKLCESHVRSVVDRVFQAQGIEARFALVVPVADCPAGYRLYLQPLSRPDSIEPGQLRSAMEQGLRENPQYRYAVGLGQLAPIELCILDPRGESAWHVFQQALLARGQRSGNIKPVALDSWTGWPEVFGPGRCPPDALGVGKPNARRPIQE